MDKIQEVLIKAGRKDLAQEYYKKVLATFNIQAGGVKQMLEETSEKIIKELDKDSDFKRKFMKDDEEIINDMIMNWITESKIPPEKLKNISSLAKDFKNYLTKKLKIAAVQLTDIDDIIQKDYNLQEQRFNEMKKQFEENQDKFNRYKDFMIEKIKVLKDNMSNVEKFLKSKGFEITKVERLRKTGPKGGFEDLVTVEDQINIDGVMKMVGKRQPIGDRSYEKGRAISSRIEEEFRIKFPNLSFSLNSASLDKADRVLFNIWVK